VRAALHVLLHFLLPLLLALVAFRPRWQRATVVLWATLLVDLDHLLARPSYAPDRCSLGFHPLHTAPALLIYVLLAAYPRTRLVGVGLLLHMALDGTDCLLM
jgi:hypothetical protein